MGYELLEYAAGLLEAAGLRTGEEYPALERLELTAPLAAVGLRELDVRAGEVRYSIRILSPRILGGWCCQVWAARAGAVLGGAGLACTAGEMEYLSGSDCFCVTITAAMAVRPTEEGWTAGERWQILCGGTQQEGVESFLAVQDRQRHLVGTQWQSKPIAVAPGKGGWTLELVQVVQQEPEEITEPFELVAREDGREIRYTGCCWNEIRYEHTRRGLRLTRRGFALGRETV